MKVAPTQLDEIIENERLKTDISNELAKIYPALVSGTLGKEKVQKRIEKEIKIKLLKKK